MRNSYKPGPLFIWSIRLMSILMFFLFGYVLIVQGVEMFLMTVILMIIPLASASQVMMIAWFPNGGYL